MYRSRKYLEFVRMQPCCAPSCLLPVEHTHHFARRHGGGGTSLKPHDTFVVPLCSAHHLEIHQRGGFKQYNFDSFNTEADFFRVALQLLTAFLMRGPIGADP
jgi:hypothetical protein